MTTLPRKGRRFERDDTEQGKPVPEVTNPIPDMFLDRLAADDSNSDPQPDPAPVEYEEEGTDDGFFARISSWFSE